MKDCITEVDIAEMIEPFSGDHPTSEDLRQYITPTSSYQILRSARTNARNEERSAVTRVNDIGEYDNQSQVAFKDWQVILTTVPSVLLNESKDIELTAWYIEALTRTFGFQGLAMGFSLARQLIEAFGEGLHPVPDPVEGTIHSQLTTLLGLNGFGSAGTLINPINMIPLLYCEENGSLGTWHCDQSLQGKSTQYSQEYLDIALKNTDNDHLQSIYTQIQRAIHEYQQFQLCLDRYIEDDQAPTVQILDALKHCLRTFRYILGDRFTQIEAKDSEIPSSDTENGRASINSVENPKDSNNPQVKPQQVPMNTRENFTVTQRSDALKCMQEVAAFFRRTEPHSPISYSIEQAIRWADLPLSDLIQELIPDDGARKKYQNLSGVIDKKN